MDQIRKFTPIRLAALTGFLLIHQQSYAACASGPGNACPIKVGGVVVFDQCFASNPLNPSPTQVGKDACKALSDAEKLGEKLGANANKFVADAARQIDGRVKQAGAAVGRELEDDIRDTQKFFAEAERDIKSLRDDSQCGVNSTLKNIGNALDEDMKKLQAPLATGPKLVQLLELAGQIAGRSGRLLESINEIASEAAKGSAEARAEFAKLERAAREFDAAMKTLLATDAGTSIAQLSADVASLGATFTAVGACATTVSAGIASLGSGGAGAVGGSAACVPSEGVGCVVAAVGALAGGAGTAITSSLAAPACTAMTAAATKLPADIAAIERIINTAVGALNNVFKAAGAMQASAQALAKMAESLPRQSEGALRKISGEISGIAAIFDRMGNIVDRELIPTYVRVSERFLTDVVARAQLAYTCYDKAVDVASDLAMDFGDLMKDHNAAAQAVHEAGKAASELQRRLARAGDAAGDVAKREWDKLKDEDRRLHREIWGVNKGTIDLGKTGAHLVSLATNPSKVRDIVDDLGKMLQRETRLVQLSVDAAADALLAPETLRPFNEKHDAAKSKSRAVKIAIAKEKAKSSALAKARQKNVRLAASAVRGPQMTSMPKIQLPELKVASKP
jgi:hypothetical protein